MHGDTETSDSCFSSAINCAAAANTEITVIYFTHTHTHIYRPYVRRRGKKTSTRRRSRISCVVVEKITTRRREGVCVVVEKNEESRRTFNKNSCDLLTAITHDTEILCALYKTNKQFNKKTKL